MKFYKNYILVKYLTLKSFASIYSSRYLMENFRVLFLLTLF